MKADAFLDSNVILYAAANVEKEAAKKQIGLRLIYSEDLSHGQVYDAVQVVNPFLELETHAVPPSG